MTSYSKLAEKFVDKGYMIEFHYLVLPPPIFVQGKVLLPTVEEELEFFNTAVQKYMMMIGNTGINGLTIKIINKNKPKRLISFRLLCFCLYYSRFYPFTIAVFEIWFFRFFFNFYCGISCHNITLFLDVFAPKY